MQRTTTSPQPGTKAAHLAAGLDAKDLRYLDVNLDRQPATVVQTAFGLISID